MKHCYRILAERNEPGELPETDFEIYEIPDDQECPDPALECHGLDPKPQRSY